MAVLIEAASRGDVAFDSEVKHEQHTRGQWILAKRVRQIREAMPASEPPPVNEVEPEEPVIDRETKPDFELNINPGRPNGRRIKLAIPRNPVHAIAAVFDFRFRYFVTPIIIKVIYAVAAVTIVLAAVYFWGAMFLGTFVAIFQSLVGGWFESAGSSPASFGNGAGFSAGSSSGAPETSAGQWFNAIVLLVILVNLGFLLPILLLRVACELVVVVFRIAEDLGSAKSSLQGLFENVTGEAKPS
ncbi:DUF4282 domain-containing protein [Rhodopirellula sp. JC740]|uniref:DUF4282 domain-containing protein n=1 Tax=Rhodopirellula halodulae TaxID=2894198 RepID=A0ABS8NPU8_9BACT|nr:DUF4282 domain-containing protein [Rhodopirellula sp. JC740]